MLYKWYALRSKPRKEEVVYRHVNSMGIDVYYPRIRVYPINPRSKKYKPYFPGYMFIHISLDDLGLSAFKWLPHTLGLVCFGDEPAIVPDNLINELKKKVEKIAAVGGELFDGLKSGDKVTINTGPFGGYEAIFDTRVPGSERVRVLLKLLNDQRQVRLELNAGQISRPN